MSKKTIDFAESNYIGACCTCNDDVYSRSAQNYVIHSVKKKAKVFCSLFCFDKFLQKYNHIRNTGVR